MAEVLLRGCQPEPLGSYLKALGVLRLVSMQADQSCRGHWTPEGFVLNTVLSEAALISFFLDDYSPTPIVSPWNGGSGFGAKDNTDGISTIEQSTLPRLAAYRSTIAAVRAVPPSVKEDKSGYLQTLRNRVPDDALEWLDAAAVLVEDGIKFPIILGTGGNDGRFDFSNNFVQRLVDALSLVPVKKAAADRPRAWLVKSLFSVGTEPGLDAAIGQFDPGAAGGSNSAPQGKGKSSVNPWDFVLTLEGTMLFAAAGVRRRGSDKSEASMPFTFRATGAGFASATEESGRGEIWAPLWAEPANLGGVQSLFAEGRVSWKDETAKTGLDAFRGLATLQGDRRVSGFTRYVIAERFGLSNVAIPVGRLVSPQTNRADVAATGALDPWLTRLRWKGDKLPSGILSGLREVDRRMVDLATTHDHVSQPERMLDLLVAVADLEQLVARSSGLRADVGPLRGVTASEWVDVVQRIVDRFGSAARIAWALASGRGGGKSAEPRLRNLLLPISAVNRWTDSAPVQGWTVRSLESVLAEVAIVRERTVSDSQDKTSDMDTLGRRVAYSSSRSVAVADAIAFANGEVDATLLQRCLQAFLLMSFDGGEGDQYVSLRSEADGKRPTSLTAAVLLHAGGSDPFLPVPVGLARQLSGASKSVGSTLQRSLRTAGLNPKGLSTISFSPSAGNWLASALLLTVESSDRAFRTLRNACSYDAENASSTDESSSSFSSLVP